MRGLRSVERPGNERPLGTRKRHMNRGIIGLLAAVLLYWCAPQIARAEMDYAGHGCSRFLGRANEALCNTQAGHDACMAELRRGRMNYCTLQGQPDRAARRATLAEAHQRLLDARCVDSLRGRSSFRCPDETYASMAYQRCIEYRNAGIGIGCRRLPNLLASYADRIAAQLEGKVYGYAFVVSKRGETSVERAAGSARLQQDGQMAMSVDVSYTLASVSKNITAAAILKLLAEKGIDVDAEVAKYLPYNWTPGAGVDTVTFRELLTHRSGFRCLDGDGVDYAGVKRCVERGIVVADKTRDCNGNAATAGAIGCYQNHNYALMRVMFPVIRGTLVKPVLSIFTPEQIEKEHAIVMANSYANYVNAELFSKAGLPKLSCAPTDGAKQGLAYKHAAPNDNGGDFGDMSLVCGSQGWFMSARQLSRYFAALNESLGSILPNRLPERMRQDLLGFQGWGQRATPYGDVRWWWHGGFHPAAMNPGEINTLVMRFSNGIELVLIINSDFDPAGFDWGSAVTNALFDAMAASRQQVP
ncbi:serine hydrolase domain-containing protein [Lysobacter brunescens]|uniref:Serine hydrolase domain-containing protein n=1 Tax=Lysobacter brunescens TaxID=262323 RepID=A0ABW2YCN5_9GAMM